MAFADSYKLSVHAVVVADQVEERNCGVITDNVRAAIARFASEMGSPAPVMTKLPDKSDTRHSQTVRIETRAVEADRWDKAGYLVTRRKQPRPLDREGAEARQARRLAAAKRAIRSFPVAAPKACCLWHRRRGPTRPPAGESCSSAAT